MKILKIALLLFAGVLFSQETDAQNMVFTNNSGCVVDVTFYWQTPCSGALTRSGSYSIFPGMTHTDTPPSAGMKVVRTDILYTGGSHTITSGHCGGPGGGTQAGTGCVSAVHWDDNVSPVPIDQIYSVN